jgi:inorganic pyrophosphatase
VPQGDDAISVLIEIPKGSRNKYEYDHEGGFIRLGRPPFSATVYPADYGLIPDTLAEDGDRLDALVLLEEATFPGCSVWARPVGVFWMEDEKGPDAKILCVPDGGPWWEGVDEVDQLPEHLLAEIANFFEVYKTLEPDKFSSTKGYEGREAALRAIEEARQRAKEP